MTKALEAARRWLDKQLADPWDSDDLPHLQALKNALLERDAPMREALEKIARLTLSSDMSDEDQADGDFEGAYDYMVELARAALSQKESKT